MNEFESIGGRKIPLISEEEKDNFRIIGSASGPSFAFCVYLGWKHSENFMNRVTGYSISDGGMAALIDAAQENMGLDKPKYINVTFYENKADN